MSEICILIASSEGGLDAVKVDAEAEIIPDTTVQFTSVSTHVSDGFWPATKLHDLAIATGKDGWMALAIKNPPSP
jgi:hypothetical protein